MIGTGTVQIISTLLIAVACVINVDAAEPDDVREAATAVPAVDQEVMSAYDALRSASGQQRSILLGQEHWRKLRVEACSAAGHAATDSDGCFQRVDDERLRELREQMDIRARELAAQSPEMDLEALLDKPINLAAYNPEDMSDIHFDGSYQAERLPRTCRELYTLTSGAWGYSNDTIGMNSEGNAFDVCQSMLFTAQAQPPKRNSRIDFNDVKLYANEIMCFALRCDDGESISKEPAESFETLKQRGNLIFESADLPMWGPDACNETLVIRQPFFCLDGMNARLEASASADYTGSGDSEAVVTVVFFPTQGTERLHCRFLASYDAQSHSIRVIRIDRNARIKLLTATD
ncbi:MULTISPECIES: hypothetical protein [unclassified Paraburkholderia]|uniref:hypothetical protein n=1 Tax=unclassified Paraburkholderia TaxID=2615204 RepID=UPI00161EC5D2|nr:MULTISPECIES: hypothetical protein [unclassified Paraburkholderia]MBB5447767.1 hypothetical protein [Paraburkholderia sp. WSM4177]MBB5488181.1 hypothetical protein [Paraburkholderia sp. WSM4180]